MNRLLRLLSLFRLHNVLAALLAVGVGYSMNNPGTLPWALLLAVSLAAAAGNVINDYYDYGIDRVNKPGRPIPAGVISPGMALIIYLLLLLALAVTLLFLTPVQTIWIICWAVLLHLYSMRFKRSLIIGNLTVSALTASGFILGAYSSGNTGTGIIPALFTFFFIFAREVVKDCEDIDGDYIFGARTMAIVVGEKVAMRVAAVMFLLLALGFPVPFLAGIYGSSYFYLTLFSIVPILLVSSYLAFMNRGAGLISIILKVGIFFGIIGFYYALRG
jgi:geranylgeranylglycerol-phosphate geranylgeranyltransferase